MRKALAIVTTILITLGLATMLSGASSPDDAGPVSGACGNAVTAAIPESPNELPDWVFDGNFAVSAASGGLPPCPLPRLCPVQFCLNGGTCQPAQCGGAQDTGISACQSGNYALQCPAGQSIHTRDCADCQCPDGTSCDGNARQGFCQ